MHCRYYIAKVYIFSIHQIYIKQDLALAIKNDVYYEHTSIALMYTMSKHKCLQVGMMYTLRPSSSNDVYTKYTSVLHRGQDLYTTQLH